MARLNLLELASHSGGFDVFVAAVQAAGVEHWLEGPTAVTVLAPTDAAFGGLSDEVLTRLIDPELTNLQDLVATHLVAGALCIASLVGMGVAPTLAGERLTVDAFELLVAVGGAVVLRPNLRASNGWLHGIDEVLARTRPGRQTACSPSSTGRKQTETLTRR